MNETKSPLLSKTLWTNLVLALTAMFIPTVNGWIVSNPNPMIMIWTGINFVLRLVTKKPIAIE